MTKHFIVRVSANLPYPIQREYKEAASKLPAAVRKALEKHRQEFKGRKIKELSIKVISY